jgi:hypothetical protein
LNRKVSLAAADFVKGQVFQSDAVKPQESTNQGKSWSPPQQPTATKPVAIPVAKIAANPVASAADVCGKPLCETRRESHYESHCESH